MLYQKLLFGRDPYFVTAGNVHSFPCHYHHEIELSFCIDGADSLSVGNTAHRLRMVKYMIDGYIAEFATKGYTNIDFAGFYWFDEFIVQADLDFQEQNL